MPKIIKQPKALLIKSTSHIHTESLLAPERECGITATLPAALHHALRHTLCSMGGV